MKATLGGVPTTSLSSSPLIQRAIDRAGMLLDYSRDNTQRLKSINDRVFGPVPDSANSIAGNDPSPTLEQELFHRLQLLNDEIEASAIQINRLINIA